MNNNNENNINVIMKIMKILKINGVIMIMDNEIVIVKIMKS
jgi:hypothetical protein